MANKLAGQRAKFTSARARYYTSSDERQRERAVQLMAEVLIEAPSNNFTVKMVTQGGDVPELCASSSPACICHCRPPTVPTRNWSVDCEMPWIPVICLRLEREISLFMVTATVARLIG